MQSHSKNFISKATKYETHNEATILKFRSKYLEFWFDLKLACRLWLFRA